MPNSPSADRDDIPTAGGAFDIGMSDLLRAFYRHRWAIVAVFALVVGAVVAYVQVATPIYEARTQLLIEPTTPEADAFGASPVSERNIASFYQTQYEVLKSRTLARRTIDELDLWDEAFVAPALSPAWTASVGTAIAPVWGRVTSGASALLGRVGLRQPGTSAEAPAGEAGEDPADLATGTIDAFLEQLTISYHVDTRLVDIVFESHDPALAATVANTLARLYATHNVEVRATPFKEAADLFGERLAEQRRTLEESELALQRYVEEHGTGSLGDAQGVLGQRIDRVTATLSDATAERLRREVLYEQLRETGNDLTALDANPAVLASAVVQRLKTELAGLQQRLAELSQRYGELHPRVIEVQAAIETTAARLTAEVDAVRQSARASYQAALDQERRLSAELQQLKRTEVAEDRKGITYRALEQEVATNRSILDTLLLRSQETSISSQLAASQVQVLDPAEVPLSPIRPQKQVIVALGAMLGGILSLGLACLLEFGSGRVRSVDGLHRLGLRSFGILPAKGRRSKQERWMAQFIESMRRIRSALLPQIGSGPLRSSVLVTSANPGDGKTTTAWTLAVVLAEANWVAKGDAKALRRPVVVVDADLRLPRVHSVFRVPQTPGLAELIGGKARLKDVVRETAFPGVYVLPAGTAEINPGAALASPRFREILRHLDEHFEWVVIDAPPVLAVSDPCLIAAEGPSVLMVVSADQTRVGAVQTALDQLAGAGAQVAGAVLNRVPVDRHPRYYTPQYGRQYEGYYQVYRRKRSA